MGTGVFPFRCHLRGYRGNVNRRGNAKKLCCCVFVHTEDDASVCDMTGSFAT